MYGRDNMELQYYYRITVVCYGTNITIEEELVEDLEEVVDIVFDFSVF